MRKLSRAERFLEIIPGVLTWSTLIAAPLLSYYKPVWISLYIILFDMYWFLKGGNVAIHLLHSYARLKVHKKIHWMDWVKRLPNRREFELHLEDLIKNSKNRGLKQLYADSLHRLSVLPQGHDFDWQKIYHLIVFPTYKEDISVLEQSIDSYVAADYPMDKIIFVLATEERGGEQAKKISEAILAKYGKSFYLTIATAHPDGIPGEVRGKAGNMNFAVKETMRQLDSRGIKYEDVIVSTLDADTIIEKDYFSHLTFDWLTELKPHNCSYQPMPVYHNNIWDTPAVARVIAISSSFWQLVEASRPDRLITFSSHAMSLKTLVDVGLFRVDSINEDSFIFWQCFMHFNGDYHTKPLFTLVSMDAVMGSSYPDTLIAQYKQKRRWAYGVSQISYIILGFYHNRMIPLWKRIVYAERFIEGHYFWATGSIMVTLLGWLPLVLGRDRFGDSVLANNLPFLTRTIMTVATGFLIFSVYINFVILPKRPKKYSRWKMVFMAAQWLYTPIVSTLFGSIPAIDAQTRVMFGKYMEFWVTPKVRKVEKFEPASESVNQVIK